MKNNHGLRLLVALFFPVAAGAAGPQNQSPSADERAMRDAFGAVLKSGDLGDMGAVSRQLELNLYLVRSERNASMGGNSAHLISSISPHFLLPNLAYDIVVQPDSRTQVTLKFDGRICPDLARWAAGWGLKLDDTFRTRAEQSIHSITGPRGLTLSVGLQGHQCRGAFFQVLPTTLPIPPLTQTQRTDGTELARKFVGLVEAGDLRDYPSVGRVLQSDIVRIGRDLASPRVEEAVLGDAIPGLDSSRSYLEVMPQAADIRLTIDTVHVCMPPDAVTQEMSKRSLDWHTADEEGTTVLRTAKAGNSFEIISDQSGDCIDSLSLYMSHDR